MTDEDLPSDLYWFTGELEKVTRAKTTSLDRLILSAFYSSDLNYAARQLEKLLATSVEPEKSCTRIALALMCFQGFALQDAERLIQEIETRRFLDSVQGKDKDFYVSSYIHLIRMLETYREELITVTKDFSSNNPCAHVIGDSHVISIGYAKLSIGPLLVPKYLPGLRMRFLADPKPNIFKTAISNALCTAAKDDLIFFSFGEIDYRLTPSRVLGTVSCTRRGALRASFKSDFGRIYEEVVRSALSYISSHKHPLQTFVILSIQPPNPHFASALALEAQCIRYEVELIETLNSLISEECCRQGLSFIDRTDDLCDSQGLLNAELMIDDKHIKYEAHRKILDKWLEPSSFKNIR
jgi:hypothetical protein